MVETNMFECGRSQLNRGFNAVRILILEAGYRLEKWFPVTREI